MVVPQETSGIEDCHGGCAPLLNDDVPSVATSRDANLQIVYVKRLDGYFGVSAQHQ